MKVVARCSGKSLILFFIICLGSAFVPVKPPATNNPPSNAISATPAIAKPAVKKQPPSNNW